MAEQLPILALTTYCSFPSSVVSTFAQLERNVALVPTFDYASIFWKIRDRSRAEQHREPLMASQFSKISTEIPHLPPRKLCILTPLDESQAYSIWMPSHTSTALAVGIVLVAFSYHSYFRNLLFLSLGLHRGLQPIEDFPYTCRPVRHKSLEGCEDMWLDEEGRALYAACGSSYSRTQWCPSYALFIIHQIML